MDLNQARDRLLLATLPHVPFEGWSNRALREAATDLGLDPTMPERLLPGGPVQMVEHFNDYADRRMVAELEALPLAEMRLTDKVRAAVRARLEPWTADREAVRRALTLLSLPQNASVAVRATWRTVDTIWWTVGDTATDFSYYTKRMTLSAIYSATALFWLEDKSEDFAETWAFLDRRLADIGRIPQVKARVSSIARNMPNPLRMLPFGTPGRGRFGMR